MTIDKPIWHCAVKNTTTNKEKWFYHLFYDFDGIKLSNDQISWIDRFMKTQEMSYILRHTMNGYHLIGLTPIDSQQWGLCFNILQKEFPTYHDGQAIRITKKMQDEFITLAENYHFPFVVNLLKLFKKVKVEDMIEGAGIGKIIKEQWYVLLYYTTNKKNIKNKEVIGVHNIRRIDKGAMA